MPIYEYYCPDNHTVYQFYAETLAQGRTVPPCPDNPAFRMQKQVSAFAVNRGRPDAGPTSADGAADGAGDARMEAAMGALEREFGQVDENDPRAMGRMMRRMAELTGEALDGGMEEVVRKLEEGVDPESLEERLEVGSGEPEGAPWPAAESPEKRHRFKPRRLAAPRRDPELYDYP